MMKPRATIFAWGIFIILSGGSAFLMPRTFASLLSLPESIIWTQAVGSLAIGVAYYYLYAAYKNNTEFMRATITGRTIFGVGIISIGLINVGTWAFVLLGVWDLLGAFWTFMAFRQARAITE